MGGTLSFLDEKKGVYFFLKRLRGREDKRDQGKRGLSFPRSKGEEGSPNTTSCSETLERFFEWFARIPSSVGEVKGEFCSRGVAGPQGCARVPGRLGRKGEFVRKGRGACRGGSH